MLKRKFTNDYRNQIDHSAWSRSLISYRFLGLFNADEIRSPGSFREDFQKRLGMPVMSPWNPLRPALMRLANDAPLFSPA